VLSELADADARVLLASPAGAAETTTGELLQRAFSLRAKK
jgi:hypothetical protein